MIQSNVALKKRHKSKTDYPILDSKKWDFQIRIILIQIKCFQQLAHVVLGQLMKRTDAVVSVSTSRFEMGYYSATSGYKFRLSNM